MPDLDNDRNSEMRRVLDVANRVVQRMGYSLVVDQAKVSHFVGNGGRAAGVETKKSTGKRENEDR